jgi:hypothetical protein
VPVIAGGVEASLRRLAHYDYWSEKVRRSILLDCKADLVVYGMGEEAIVEIARRLAAGQTVKDLRDLRGIAYALGAKETPPEDALLLPSYEQVVADKPTFAEATRIIHNEPTPTTPAAWCKCTTASRRLQSAPVSPLAALDGCDLWPALYPPAASRLQRTDPRNGDDQRFRHHHARLLWRLHFLQHYRPSGPHYPIPQ